MKTVGISLEALYNKFGGQLVHGEIIKEIDGEWEYYDLQTLLGTVCMDGEICEVINSGDYGYELLSEGEDERENSFILTNEEYDVGVYEVDML